MELARKTETGAKPSTREKRPTEAQSCCAPREQATCCEPGEKDACCGTAKTTGTCGCR
jgi:hypothetical protein